MMAWTITPTAKANGSTASSPTGITFPMSHSLARREVSPMANRRPFQGILRISHHRITCHVDICLRSRCDWDNANPSVRSIGGKGKKQKPRIARSATPCVLRSGHRSERDDDVRNSLAEDAAEDGVYVAQLPCVVEGLLQLFGRKEGDDLWIACNFFAED